MGYIYRLVNNEEMELAKEGKILLRRPFLSEFHSEGKFINFIKDIHNHILKINNNNDNVVNPTKDEISKINKWIESYEKNNKGISEDDLKSNSEIIFTQIMHGYCSYYTKENLFDEKTREKYCKENKSISEYKVGSIRIDEEIIDKKHWHSNNSNSEYERKNQDSECFNGYNAFSHLLDINYIQRYNDYDELLKLFCNEQNLKICFNVLSDKYKPQKEKRILLHLYSFIKNTISTGYPKDEIILKEEIQPIKTQKVFLKAANAAYYSVKNAPNSILLNLGTNAIDYFEFN